MDALKRAPATARRACGEAPAARPRGGQVKSETRAGFGFLERAKLMNPGMRQRFSIFILERKNRQRMQTESTGDGSMDLLAYVEFQTTFQALLNP